VLELDPRASRAEVERTGQKLIALLELGSAGAARYDTPFGSATRDADGVRQAVAALRDPIERVIHELWVDVARDVATSHSASGSGSGRAQSVSGAWTAAGRAIGWSAKWAE
jgi:hypothetical protein